MSSIGDIIKETHKLHETVDAVSGKTQNLAAAATEIEASMSTILEATNGVKERLKALQDSEGDAAVGE